MSSAELSAERDELSREGVLDRLAATCQGDLPFALRYAQPDGSDEIVTSVTPIRTPAGCWAVVTSFSAAALPGAPLGRPYWESQEVRAASVIYLAMVLLTFTTFWSIRRGLKRFAERASAIRERRPGGSFGAQNDVPELADVAEEFDRMVEVLAASARDIRRAAEDNAHAFKTPIAVIRQSLEPLKRAVDADNQRGRARHRPHRNARSTSSTGSSRRRGVSTRPPPISWTRRAATSTCRPACAPAPGAGRRARRAAH